MAAGHSIGPAAVAAFVAPTVVVIAHNPAFDRRFWERFSGVFTTKPRARSTTKIDRAIERYERTKLAYLMQSSGLFFEGRLDHDSQPWQVDGEARLPSMIDPSFSACSSSRRGPGTAAVAFWLLRGGDLPGRPYLSSVFPVCPAELAISLIANAATLSGFSVSLSPDLMAILVSGSKIITWRASFLWVPSV